jgi:uncharacterized membrane protein YphA (DoxX/SURF4 family)
MLSDGIVRRFPNKVLAHKDGGTGDMATIEAIRERTARATVRASDPTDQAFLILRSGFTVAPILFGLDKFFNVMVDWPIYLAPWVDRLVPGTAQEFMYAVGVIEIAAGVAVALRPRFGSLLVAGWLAGIVVNLLTVDPPRYYDIALRDFGLMLGALALARLAASADRRQTRG